MMRRFPHGSTARPMPARPGNGYGRSIRPGPDLMRSMRLLDEAPLLDETSLLAETSLLDARSGDQGPR